MKSQIDQLLHASLILDATYDEKQLLKAGKLGECAVKVLQRRKKSARYLMLVYAFMLCLPMLGMFVGAMTSSSTINSNAAFTPLLLASLWQLPNLIELRASQTRLETLIAMWLLSDHEKSTSDTDEQESEIFKALFAGV
jgi:ABC-type glycerol-3-phosphate transport system permease component